MLRARALGVPTRIVHNASIMNAVGACGLQLYNFGQTVSLVFFTDSWRPDSFYDRIRENADLGMHTLVLLHIKVKEQSEENLARLVAHPMPMLEYSPGNEPEEGKSTSRHDTCRSPRRYLSSSK